MQAARLNTGISRTGSPSSDTSLGRERQRDAFTESEGAGAPRSPEQSKAAARLGGVDSVHVDELSAPGLPMSHRHVCDGHAQSVGQKSAECIVRRTVDRRCREAHPQSPIVQAVHDRARGTRRRCDRDAASGPTPRQVGHRPAVPCHHAEGNWPNDTPTRATSERATPSLTTPVRPAFLEVDHHVRPRDATSARAPG